MLYLVKLKMQLGCLGGGGDAVFSKIEDAIGLPGGRGGCCI